MNRRCRFLLVTASLSLSWVGLIRADPPPKDSVVDHPGSRVVPRAELRDLANRAERELRGDILPFWLKYTRDLTTGGFYGLIDEHMKVHRDSPRGALLTSRILWTFSKAYRVYHDPAYLEMARWAYRDFEDHFTDREFGGVYWTITADGRPLDDHKQIYMEAFGVYALAEYYRATGEKGALEAAIAIYSLVEKYAHDRQYGGYLDSLDRKWAPTPHNLLGDAPKTQNSHIHILEAYTNLLRVWPDPELKENQRQLVEVTIQHLINPRTHHLILDLQPDWTPTSDKISFGHDIELSWLLVEAAQVLGDPAMIARVQPVALQIAQATLAEGVDADGGVFNEADPHGYTDANKDWWPQAEAVVGFLNAYQLTLAPRYFEAARQSWDFIAAKFVDRTYGDWIEKVRRDGTPIPRPKVTLWKCPYHSSRSCFEVIERVDELIGAGR